MSDTNVLHLITRFVQGGAETTIINEIDALAEAPESYDVRLGFGLEHNASRVDDVRTHDVATVCFDHIRHYDLIRTIPAVRQVQRYLEAESIDIIHTHSTEAGIIGRFAAALAGTPAVIHEIHGDPVSEDRNLLLNGFVVALERVAARTATTIIVKSNRIQEAYLQRGIGRPDQYELIYHGVDRRPFQDAEPSTVPDPSVPTLLFAGRLEDGKGLFDLLDAFESVVQETSAQLLIAGDGPSFSAVKEAIRSMDLSDHVRLLGYRDDVPALMAASDGLVLPSYREGTPRVITEARAAGLPVIATNIAGIPEQIEDGVDGILIQPGDIPALESAIVELVAPPSDQHSLRFEDRNEVTRFSKSQAQKEIAELYRGVFPESGGRSRTSSS